MATEAVGRAREDVAPATTPKTFRTLFHVIALPQGKVRTIVPGWNSRKPVSFEKSILPESILSVLTVDYIFYAQVNLDASSPEDLVKSMAAFEPGGMLPKKELA
ncbi:MAG TPA: hypothetical protein VI636_01215 [Candidatus Angelobacter sp.]